MTDLIKLLDELDRLEKDATPVPWDGYDNIQPVRNRDFILALRNNWPRISAALRDAHRLINGHQHWRDEMVGVENVKDVVKEQTQDGDLWKLLPEEYGPEDCFKLQIALRRLHAAIEGEPFCFKKGRENE